MKREKKQKKIGSRILLVLWFAIIILIAVGGKMLEFHDKSRYYGWSGGESSWLNRNFEGGIYIALFLGLSILCLFVAIWDF